MTKKVILFLNLILCSCYLISQNKNVNIDEKLIKELNTKADEQFIAWKIKNNAPHLSDNLKKILSDQLKIGYLARKSQMPFNEQPNNNVINSKIRNIITDFKKEFKNLNLSNQDEQKLKDFLRQLIIPELSIFNLSSGTQATNLYENFMNMLKTKKTVNGSNLAQWSQRYLTSQSLITALPILQKQITANKNFYQLSENEQSSIINQAAQMVVNQYIANAQSWRDKFSIKIPDELSAELVKKVTLFLKLKLQPF